MSLSVFELMSSYNISLKQAQILQFEIIGIMILIVGGLFIVQLLLRRFCPDVYERLKKINIV